MKIWQRHLLVWLEVFFVVAALAACGDTLGGGSSDEKKRDEHHSQIERSSSKEEKISTKEEFITRRETEKERRSLEEEVLQDVDASSLREEPFIEEESVVEVPPEKTRPPSTCGLVVFRYDAASKKVQTALVSGNFNNWADSAQKGAYVMKNVQGSIWEFRKKFQAGTYEYKFIIDGKWLQDPTNPNKKPDGYGGFNSLLTVPECRNPKLIVMKHSTKGQNFDVTLRFEPGESKSPLKTLTNITLDFQKVPSHLWKISGNMISISLKNLPKGIHDLRVKAKDRSGQETSEKLLKIYIGYSSDWRDVSLYFVMVDRFLDADLTNNHPIAGAPSLLNYMGGDFKGVMKKLEDGYFEKLGINALWITWPIDNPDHGEPGKRFASHWCHMNPKDSAVKYKNTVYTGYHGYWPAKLDKVEEHFGSLQELQELVKKAHKRGIRILLDFTVNHVHKDSDLYKKYKNKGYFNMPPKICSDVGWDKYPVTCWFVSYLPDLNYRNPDLTRYMLDYIANWVKKTGADGLRVDALKHIDFSFIKALRRRMASEFEGTGVSFYMVGETFTGNAADIKKFIGKDKVQGQFDFALNNVLLRAFAKGYPLDAFDRAARSIMSVYGKDALMSNFIGNHDIARFISLASGDLKCGVWDVISNRAQAWTAPPAKPTTYDPYRKLQLAFTYLFTIPGIPLIYYGDEFGMPGAGDPDNRRMMRFDSQLSDYEKRTLAFMQKLGKIRQKYEVLRRGVLGSTLLSSSKILVYPRIDKKNLAIIVLNIGQKRNIPIPATGVLGLNDGDQLMDLLSGKVVTVRNGQINVEVKTLSSMILFR